LTPRWGRSVASFVSAAILVYALDAVTKMAVRARMPIGHEIPILPFFSLAHVKNTGIAFGMFQNQNGLFVVLGLILAALLVRFGLGLYRDDRVSGLAVAGLLGGALGNLTDRVLFGRVTDFLDFYWRSYHWPVFNVADSAICVGAGLILLRSFMGRARSDSSVGSDPSSTEASRPERGL
jgi:signal peptidase II